MPSRRPAFELGDRARPVLLKSSGKNGANSGAVGSGRHDCQFPSQSFDQALGRPEPGTGTLAFLSCRCAVGVIVVQLFQHDFLDAFAGVR